MSQLNIVLAILTDANHIAETECDEIINQFKQFRETILNSEASSDFSSFTVSDNLNRLDTFWYNHLNGSSYRSLWKIFKILLLLSHGQASVERGFSQNKEIMVDNMSEHCLKSQRIIVDNIKHVGGIQNIQMDKPMLIAVSGARQRYYAYLDEKKKDKEREEKSKKRKSVLEEIQEISAKKKRFEKDITSLESSAVEFADKAEKQGKLTLIAKSNALRRAAKEKGETVKEMDSLLQAKYKELTN